MGVPVQGSACLSGAELLRQLSQLLYYRTVFCGARNRWVLLDFAMPSFSSGQNKPLSQRVHSFLAYYKLGRSGVWVGEQKRKLTLLIVFGLKSMNNL